MAPESRSDTRRLFIALWPDARVRSALAAHQHGWRWPQRAAVVPADKLHVTLHFIGNVAAERVDDLKAALRRPFTSFAVEPTSAGVWHGGIAVVETDLPPALSALHAALGDALASLELPLDSRRYRPHVTLARKAQGATPPAIPTTLRWSVDGYALMLSAAGRYTVIERYG
jgi:2'-5' RNA ligase